MGSVNRYILRGTTTIVKDSVRFNGLKEHWRTGAIFSLYRHCIFLYKGTRVHLYAEGIFIVHRVGGKDGNTSYGARCAASGK